jgi:hypothetical protein
LFSERFWPRGIWSIFSQFRGLRIILSTVSSTTFQHIVINHLFSETFEVILFLVPLLSITFRLRSYENIEARSPLGATPNKLFKFKTMRKQAGPENFPKSRLTGFVLNNILASMTKRAAAL